MVPCRVQTIFPVIFCSACSVLLLSVILNNFRPVWYSENLKIKLAAMYSQFNQQIILLIRVKAHISNDTAEEKVK